jgi:predicted metal-binding membrane protein
VLVALGTMNLAWMLALATLILLEKNAPAGHRIAQAAAAAFVAIGLLLILHPETITTLT